MVKIARDYGHHKIFWEMSDIDTRPPDSVLRQLYEVQPNATSTCRYLSISSALASLAALRKGLTCTRVLVARLSAGGRYSGLLLAFDNPSSRRLSADCRVLDLREADDLEYLAPAFSSSLHHSTFRASDMFRLHPSAHLLRVLHLHPKARKQGYNARAVVLKSTADRLRKNEGYLRANLAKRVPMRVSEKPAPACNLRLPA